MQRKIDHAGLAYIKYGKKYWTTAIVYSWYIENEWRLHVADFAWWFKCWWHGCWQM